MFSPLKKAFCGFNGIKIREMNRVLAGELVLCASGRASLSLCELQIWS
jgi:hypothetical protein